MTTYLITGANRGIGLGLTTDILKRPSTTLIAAVRDPSHSTSHSLLSLPTGSDSRLILIKIDSSDTSSAKTAIEKLQKEHPEIKAIDVVIANAGISNTYKPARETPLEDVDEHFQINTLAPLALFQATYSLLKAAQKPQFVAISSPLGSLGDMGQFPLPTTAYGSSKSALNHVVRKIHFEEEWLITYPLSPGWVQTDMGNVGAKAAGMEAAPVTMEQSVKGILEVVDGATREETGGEFQSFDRAKYAW